MVNVLIDLWIKKTEGVIWTMFALTLLGYFMTWGALDNMFGRLGLFLCMTSSFLGGLSWGVLMLYKPQAAPEISKSDVP